VVLHDVGHKGLFGSPWCVFQPLFLESTLSLSYSSSTSPSAVTMFAIIPWASTMINKLGSASRMIHQRVADSPLYDVRHQDLVRVSMDAWLCSFPDSTLSRPAEEIEGNRRGSCGYGYTLGKVILSCLRVESHSYVLFKEMVILQRTYLGQITNPCPCRTVCSTPKLSIRMLWLTNSMAASPPLVPDPISLA
jgi:hypothetical protein